MRDPFLWSIPLGRLFGINVRVHILYPVLVLVLVLRVVYKTPKDYPSTAWLDVLILAGLLLVSVIFHEFGHCFAARRQQGEATEILIWPLGGLANIDVPHTPWAHFFTAAAGPIVNLALCVICALLLGLAVNPAYQPPWNPLSWSPFRDSLNGALNLHTWAGISDDRVTAVWPVFLARFFYVNWVLFLLNVLLMGYPLDGGRMLQSALWPHLGYRQSMLVSIFAGFVAMFIVGIVAIVINDFIWLSLAMVIYFACKHQWIVLETGGEDGLFGYDFSQGYTSLERDQPARPARKVGWWKGWLQRRAARKLQRETEQREAEERRLDELLEKVQRLGIRALTDEERRFMKRVSDRYRNRN
jgi:Zn-dependent protease